MAPRVLPGGIGLKAYAPLYEPNWNTWLDDNLWLISVLLMGRVKSATTALPGSPTNGDIYIVPGSSGSHPNEIAVRDSGTWTYIVPQVGWRFYAIDSTLTYEFDGTTWTASSVRVGNESASTSAAQIDITKKGSTAGIASPVAALGALGALVFSGWKGSAYSVGAKIVAQAQELWSGTANGSSLIFQVVANGTTAMVDRLQLTASALLPAQTDLVVNLGSATTRWLKGWFGNISLFPGSSVTPTVNGEMTFELTSDTELKVKVKGSDGTVRSVSLTLS